MLGDVKLGAVLRELRAARRLTLAAVARQAGCVESTVSYVEGGHRRLQPWLAQELDRIYETGGVIAALASGVGDGPHQDLVSGVPDSDVFVVLLPQGGGSVLLSRREVLAALGVGIASGKLQGRFERALEGISHNINLLKYFGNWIGPDLGVLMWPRDLSAARQGGVRWRGSRGCCRLLG